jgi:hypothetical protein
MKNMTTTITMNPLDEKICEQLSAWMDGELSKEEALFLERRLQHDEALQAMYTRLQMTSACMKGQSARLMPSALCANIKQALAEETSSRKSRRPLFAWAAAASMAFAAIVFIPGFMQDTATPEPRLASTSESIIKNEIDPPATFASADLIGNRQMAVSTSIVASSSNPAGAITPAVNPSSIESVAGVISPEDFPLIISNEKKSWPRSVVNANSDPALEAYLVRHNQMMAQDGMGGFVPYVDVVAQDAGQAGKGTEENAGGNK